MNSPGAPATIRVDDRVIDGRCGESLLDVLTRNGFEVPSLCHVPGIEPYGACRLCLVEIHKGKRRMITTSCNYPVEPGLEVHLDTPGVQSHRRTVLGLLLSLAPGSTRLCELAERYGVTGSPYSPPPSGKRFPDCILCGLCVRVCREVVGADVLAWAGRGRDKHVERRPFGGFPAACIGCGACAFVCPTGAISMEPAWTARQRGRWGHERPCRYSLMDLVPGATCENDYRCDRCEVDQRMVDRAHPRHPVFLARGQLRGGKRR